MSNKNKIIVVFLFIIISIGVGIIIAISQSKVGPTPEKIPAPIIPKQIQGELPIQKIIEKKDFEFPQKAPLLNFTFSELGKEESQSVANKLGFKGEPITVDDVREGTKYIWSNDTFYFVSTLKTAILKYGLNNLITTVPSKNLNDKDLVKIASDFLSQNLFLDNEEIKFTSIVFLKENSQSEGFQESSRDETDVFQINFAYNISDYEIVTLKSSEPLIFVQVQKDGTIFRVQITKLKEITKTDEEYSLKTYEDVLASLDEAVLMDLVNVYLSIPDLSKEDIKSIDVENVKLAYLFENPKTGILQPIFILQGQITLTDYSSGVEAILYMPALARD